MLSPLEKKKNETHAAKELSVARMPENGKIGTITENAPVPDKIKTRNQSSVAQLRDIFERGGAETKRIEKNHMEKKKR